MKQTWGNLLSVENSDNWSPDWADRKIEEVKREIFFFKDVSAFSSKMDKRTRTVTYNIVNNDGVPIEECKYLRGAHLDAFKYSGKSELSPNDDVTYVNKTVVYLGWLNPHYGHFLMESLSRLWVVEKLDRDILKDCFFYYDIHTPKEDFETKGWIFKMLDVFGINESNIILGNRNYFFSDFIVPSQAMRLHNGVNVDACNYIWSEISSRISMLDIKKCEFEKVYLSRSGLAKDKRRLANEELLEKELKKIGFIVLYPEQMSLEEQISIYKNVRTLVGPSGSALHNAAFMTSGARVISLTTEDFCLLNELLCCRVNQINYSVFLCEGESKSRWSVPVDKLVKYLSNLRD